MPTDLKTLVNNLYDLLEPVESADRRKAIKAALTMLDDETSVTNDKAGERQSGGDDDSEESNEGDFNPKTRSWMTRNKVTSDQLNHVFHIEGETVEIILDSVPGKNQKQQTINAYPASAK
jgi:hypothetical protein